MEGCAVGARQGRSPSPLLCRTLSGRLKGREMPHTTAAGRWSRAREAPEAREASFRRLLERSLKGAKA